MARRVLSLIVCSLVVISLSSCGAKSPQNILDDGMSQFGNGKSEEDYHFKNSGVLLDELIEKYSGSYYQPTGTTMTDDEHDDAKKAQGYTGTTPDPSNPSVEPGTTTPSNEADVLEVSNMTELMRVFHEAYDQTAESVEFTTASGFSFDMNNDL
jgi:hypothetical protein